MTHVGREQVFNVRSVLGAKCCTMTLTGEDINVVGAP
jgi:hypothetical protein